MKLSQEGEALLANIGSLTDQMKQLQEGEKFGLDPELEEEPDAGVEAIFAKLVDGQPLESGEAEQLGEATAGGGELVEDLIAKLASGATLTEEELVILKAALESEGEELAEAEAVVKAIVERSLQGVPREAAVPLLAGLRGIERGGGMVRKRWGNWADARADGSPVDPDLVRLFGTGRVAKDLPSTLEPEGEEEEGSDLLRLAVSKMAAGKPLSEAELLELMAENQKGRPLGLAADMPVHKELIPFNRTRPVESLQETMGEVQKMIAGEERDIELNRYGRSGKRKDLVRKSLGAAVNALLGQRQ